MKYDMIHELTIQDVTKLEGIAYACRMDVAVAEFRDDDNSTILRLKRVILTDSDFCLSSPNTREILFG